MAKGKELVVFMARRPPTCGGCGDELWKGAPITLTEDRNRALCLSCADLDHLIYLPAGDAALTRRSRKLSKLSAVVVQWSRTRKRYERQGVLVEEAALEAAEAHCLADAEARAARREREARRRERLDGEYVDAFTTAIGEHFPGCPAQTARAIAEHACLKHSGRVGRSAAAKAFDERAVRLAVIAHIRHAETPYDELLMGGLDREGARLEVGDQVDEVLRAWRNPPG